MSSTIIDEMSQEARGRTNPECTGRRHTATNGAWKLGCRCAHAVAAHEKWKQDNRGRLTMVPPALDMAGRCLAEKHDTRIAYVRAGCRCPEAVRRYDAKNKRSTAARRGKGSRHSNADWMERSRYAKQMTGGRLDRDPRDRWRGPKFRVDRTNLMFALTGGRITLNQGEKLAAVLRMRAVLMPSGPRRWREIAAHEVADRLGITEREVFRVEVVRRRMREQRTERRAADVAWRSAVVAAAIDRRAERAHATRAVGRAPAQSVTDPETAYQRAWRKRRESVRGLGGAARRMASQLAAAS